MSSESRSMFIVLSFLCALSFFFYKSVLSESPFKSINDILTATETLQVQIHRDILEYRNGHIKQYDPLNKLTHALKDTSKHLVLSSKHANEYTKIHKALGRLHTEIDKQELLIEDFKLYNAILQNSLKYLATTSSIKQTASTEQLNRASNDPIYISIGRLSTVLLQYIRDPSKEHAVEIYSIVDTLNVSPSREMKTIILHSLAIVENLPEMEIILKEFREKKVSSLIAALHSSVSRAQYAIDDAAKTYNALLFFSALLLLAYLIILFRKIKQSSNELSLLNDDLSNEVHERIKTEKTMYNLVQGTSRVTGADYVKELTRNLCDTLEVKSAYISTILTEDAEQAEIIGIWNDNRYKEHIEYDINKAPCKHARDDGKYLCLENLTKKFPECGPLHNTNFVSYIGVALYDNHEKVCGILAIVDDKKLTNTTLAESILRLLASRASTELARQTEQLSREKYQHGLEQLDHWVKKLILSSTDSDALYRQTCVGLQDLCHADLVSFWLNDVNCRELTNVAATGNNAAQLRGNTMLIKESKLSTWVNESKRAVLITDTSKDSRFDNEIASSLDINSVIASPLLSANTVIGGLVAYRKGIPFSGIEKQILQLYCHRVETALINMELLSHIADQKERAEITLHSIGDAVITTDRVGLVEYMNQVAENLTGWKLTDAKSRKINEVFNIIDDADRTSFGFQLSQCLDDCAIIEKQMSTLINKENEEFYIENSISPILDKAGKTVGMVIVFHDETESRNMAQAMSYQARHDSLTGLCNRVEFDAKLSESVDTAINENSHHALCYLDLDQFKLVNDTSGHAAGDDLLKQISQLLIDTTRKTDVLARLGGDEFGLILLNCSMEKAREVCEQIINNMNTFQFTWDNRPFDIGVSIGLVPIDHLCLGTSELMKHADVACYTAKDHGRGQVYVYEAEDEELVRRHAEMHWASRITLALEENRFELHAQSITALDCPPHKRPFHAEILVRMKDKDGTIVPPGAFIPAAERYNLMDMIDRWVIENTFVFFADIFSLIPNEDICVSINLSGTSLTDINLVEFISLLLEKHNIPPHYICFEITETAAISNLNLAMQLIDSLKTLGCKFALDDFGSGLSSFGYLKQMPVDYLKIDGAFVRNMSEDIIDQEMVAAINAVGHVMNLKTIAEFVENEETINILKSFGVNYAQGYHIDKPMPVDEYMEAIIHQPKASHA